LTSITSLERRLYSGDCRIARSCANNSSYSSSLAEPLQFAGTGLIPHHPFGSIPQRCWPRLTLKISASAWLTRRSPRGENARSICKHPVSNDAPFPNPEISKILHAFLVCTDI
jgi:hypothetical protein